MILQTINDWTNCKITLTNEFAEKRLVIYKDNQNIETQKFISLYGEQHHSSIINWLEKIKNNERY
jgi:hypothetical protein